MLYLDKQEFRVFACVRRYEDFENITKETSSRVTPLLLDVVDEISIVKAVKIVQNEVGDAGIHGLVNNAGIFVGGPLEFIPTEALRNQFEVNVVGQIAVTQKFLPLLRLSQGCIIFVGSTSGLVAPPIVGPYSASKYALRALVDSLRNELVPSSISVSLVVAGSVTTPIWNKAFSSMDEILKNVPTEAQAYYKTMLDKTVARGLIRSKVGIPPKEVAKAIHHALISRNPRAQYLVGIDAKLQAFAFWLLPARIVDRMFRFQLDIKEISH
jgi:NAD(P)-dependent dehydrogenase (short-subunit alcohol dehydrogenase family)